MNHSEFLHDLHFNIDKVRPVDLDVDWDNAPLPYKLYRGVESIPLPNEVAFELDMTEELSEKASLRDVGNLLWHTYGLTQVSQTEMPVPDGGGDVFEMQAIRRFVPSGGALYPSELYVYLKIGDVPTGVYHYDAAHHHLVLLRQGEYDDYIHHALRLQPDVAKCTAIIFVSCLFWKNFFKYHDFSYRLQGLDAGALIGQLLEVSKRLGLSSKVHHQFLDVALNHLLGLSTSDESVYAVIALEDGMPHHDGERNGEQSVYCGNHEGEGAKKARLMPDAVDFVPPRDASHLCRTIPSIDHDHHMKSERAKFYPTLVEMNQAALMSSFPEFRRSGMKPVETLDSVQALKSVANGHRDHVIPSIPRAPTPLPIPISVALPNVVHKGVPFTEACRMRYSPGLDFRFRALNLNQMASLLKTTMSSFAYSNDIDTGDHEAIPRVSLAVCTHGVEGLEDGAYQYNPRQHTLVLLREGDHRMQLQLALSMPNVNMFEVPLCFHVVGNRDHFTSRFGCRGYRMEQMEAGMLVQRLLLSAASIGMLGHPLLGYDVGLCDEIYNMTDGSQTCLIQIPVGFAYGAPRLQGSLRT